MHNRGWAAAGIAAGAGGLALVLAACGSSATSTHTGTAYGAVRPASPASSASPASGMTGAASVRTATLAVRSTSIGSVLTNAQGHTLYWYASDTKDSPSTCTGSC